MKISRIETFAGWAHYCNWLFLRVETDDGLVGWGEATLPGPLSAVEGVINELAPLFVGEHFEGVEVAWQKAYHAWRWRGGAVSQTAVSAFDIAFWDLEAKALGVPVHRLLGGALRQDVPCYSSHHMWTDPETAERDAKEVAAKGYTGLKWVLLSIWNNREIASSIDLAVDIMAAAREGAGQDVQLFIDCSEVLTVDTARRLARALEPYDIGFLEEPVPFENPKAMLRLRDEIDIPFATGERLLSRWEFRELIEDGGPIILQPDVMHCGGLTEARKIASAAETYYLPISPHNAAGPVSSAAAVHLGLTVPNFMLLETMDDERATRDRLCVDPIVCENGVISRPDAPGLGVELNVEELRKLTYKPSPAGKAPKLWLG